MQGGVNDLGHNKVSDIIDFASCAFAIILNLQFHLSFGHGYPEATAHTDRPVPDDFRRCVLGLLHQARISLLWGQGERAGIAQGIHSSHRERIVFQGNRFFST